MFQTVSFPLQARLSVKVRVTRRAEFRFGLYVCLPKNKRWTQRKLVTMEITDNYSYQDTSVLESCS